MEPKVLHNDGRKLVDDIKLSIETMLQKKVIAVKVRRNFVAVARCMRCIYA